jgi:hypothetical protein
MRRVTVRVQRGVAREDNLGDLGVILILLKHRKSTESTYSMRWTFIKSMKRSRPGRDRPCMWRLIKTLQFMLFRGPYAGAIDNGRGDVETVNSYHQGC